jgi:hypothetical protein
MKQLTTAAIFLFSSLFYGQNNGYGESALFLDSVLISSKTLQYINNDLIASLNVVKRDTIIDDKHFKGQLFITSKNHARFDFTSLSEIKENFTKLKKEDVVYMVNGEFIKENSEGLKLDRNYILKVEVTNSSEFYNLRKNDVTFDIINIFLKNHENIGNKNKIIMRD